MTTDDALLLSEAHKQAFDQQGYLALDWLTSAEEVEALQAVYDRLFEQGAGISEKDRLELAVTRTVSHCCPRS